MNNEKDWLKRVAGIEDAGLAVTNAVLLAYEGAAEMAQRSQSEFAAVVDKAIALHFGKSPRMSSEEKYKILDSLLVLHRSRDELQGRESMSGIWTSTIDTLSKYSKDECITLHRKPGVAVSKRPFDSYMMPDRLVVGHYHVPRQEEPGYDVGGFFGNVTTWLAVRSDGTIGRPV